jgi:glutamate-1-semialdehyde 2,1-aminomutase/spore coat polysaccharide biosynthesis protein SpsF
LGYAHPEINDAVASQMAEGMSFSLPHPLEVQLAELLCEIIPGCEMVRFGKNGSDVTSGAIRAARAYTGRNHVACCGYHGWQDWYIGTTKRDLGVPDPVKQLTHPFIYNDIASLQKTFDQYPKDIAAVIMEPVNFVEPAPGFLQEVKRLAHSHGALLVFDEICTGFHFGLGGAQKKFNVTPDLSCFGKALGNGYPISCVVGRREVMKVFNDIFFSFTFAGDVAGFAAAIKVIEILRKTDVIQKIEEHGRMLKDGINTFAQRLGLEKHFSCEGYPNWTLIRYKDAAGQDSLLVKSLFQQEALKRGLLLLATHNLSGAHQRSDIETTLETYAVVFKVMAEYLSETNPAKHLEGTMIEPVFKVR